MEGEQKQLCENETLTENLPVPARPITPTLRVEELKEDEKVRTTSGSDPQNNSPTGSEGEEQTAADFVVPDEDLLQRIIQQVEFYFSNESILKDAFLLKHVRRNKQGYVSIKLITSFKRVKGLTKDYRVVAYALKQSDKLEVNPENTKVRRLEPLPDYDETTPSRSIVAINIPLDNPQVGGVGDLFKDCGEVTLVRLLKVGKPYPPEVKKYVSKYPDLSDKPCAIIEFEKHECAQKAVELFNNTADFQGMKVHVLATNKKKGGDDEEKKKKLSKKKPRVNELATHTGGGDSSSETDNLEYYSRNKNANGGVIKKDHLSPAISPKSSPRSSPGPSPRSSPMFRRRSNPVPSPLAASPVFSPNASPRMQRGELGVSWRKKQDNKGNQNFQMSPRTSPRMARRILDGGIIRQPRGPDNAVQGFYGGKGRGTVVATN